MSREGAGWCGGRRDYAAGDGPAQDHELGVQRQLADELTVAGAGRDHREVTRLGRRRNASTAASTAAGSSVRHSATVVWPVRSMRMSRDMDRW